MDKTRCVWINSDPEYNVYNTECGDAFQFSFDGPCKNNFNYCPFCGKPIKHREEKESEGEADFIPEE